MLTLMPPIINAPTGIMLSLGLAYVPFFLKLGAVKKSLEQQKVKKFDNISDLIGNGRSASTIAASTTTPEGLAVQRFNGCHLNGLEAFSYFSSAVVLAFLCNVPKSEINSAASLFVLIRLMYTVVYLSPLNGPLRSVIWTSGLSVCMYLMYRASEEY